MRLLLFNMKEEQTTLEDFDLWCNNGEGPEVTRVLPWWLRVCTEGIEDNILRFYGRWTDEDIVDNIKILRDTMTDSELERLKQPQPLWPPSFFEGIMNFTDDRFTEQEAITDSPVKWRILWGDNNNIVTQESES